MKKNRLNHIISKIWKRTKDLSIGIKVLIVIELLVFLAFLATDLSRSRTEFSLPVSSFIFGETDNVKSDDASLVFSQDGNEAASNTPVLSNTFYLPPGGYQFFVTYDSDTDGNSDFTHYSGSFTIISDHHEIEAETVNLDDGHKSVCGRFWIPVLSRCDDLHFSIQYNGLGALRITGCSVTESLKYRVVKYVVFLLLSVIINLLVLIFFTDHPIKVNKNTAILIGVVLVSFIPYLNNTMYHTHDTWSHMNRIVAVAQGLSDGQFPVRLSGELNNGYGYAYSLYYCDIFLYMSALLYLIKLPLRICYQCYVMAVNIFTCLFTYHALSGFTKHKNTQVLGTILYMLCSYRLANFFIRGAVGEYTAMCFLPLIVAGLYRTLKEDRPTVSDWFPLAFGMAGVIMCHIITLEMLVINIAMLCIAAFKRFLNINRIKAFLKALITCFLMTAWFVIPFFNSITGQTTVVQKESLKMLGSSSLPWGYLLGFFSPGHGEKRYKVLGLPFVIGILILLYCLYDRKRQQIQSENPAVNISGFRIICVFAFLNVLFVSKSFPWGWVQNSLGLESLGYQIGTIQFAWRFLAIASVLISVAVVIALDCLRISRVNLYKTLVTVISLSIILNCGFFYYMFFDYAETEKWSNIPNYLNSDTLYLLEGSEISDCNISKTYVTAGSAEITDYKKQNGDVLFNAANNSDDQTALITIPVFAYQNYHVYEEQNGVTVKELEHGKDDYNRITITLPNAYEGMVRISYVEPLSWRFSEAASLLTWLVILAAFLIRFKTSVVSSCVPAHKE